MIPLPSRNQSHNQSGMTFIEVMFTVALIGTVVTALISVQTNVLRLVARSSDRITAILAMKSMLAEANFKPEYRQGREFTFEKILADQEIKLRYELFPEQEKEERKKGPLAFQGIRHIKVVASWNKRGFAESEELHAFVFMPLPSKDKEKK